MYDRCISQIMVARPGLSGWPQTLMPSVLRAHILQNFINEDRVWLLDPYNEAILESLGRLYLSNMHGKKQKVQVVKPTLSR